MANGSFLGQKTKITVVRNKAGAVPDGQKAGLAPQFTCCTDGLRPVVFKIQSMETDG